MLTPHHLKSLLSSFVYTPAYTCSHILTNEHDPHHYDVVIARQLPKGFTEYIFHTGNASELNSVIRNGLIPGGTSLKRGRQVVFFTAVNPMEDGNSMGETPCDLTKPRIALYKNTWKRCQNTVYWCNLKLAQEKGLHFYQTRSHAVALYNTLLAACIEKAVCMKTQDELYQKVRLTPRVPRVVLIAIRSTRSTKPRSKIIWRPTKRLEKLRGNL